MSAIERILTGARWSEAVRCPRMAAITARGDIPEAPHPRLAGMYERGHQIQAWYAEQVERATPVERERGVQWGAGWIAHVDLVIPEWDNRHAEVKSTTAVDKLPGCKVEISGVETTSAVLQIVGGTAFDPEGGVAEVVAVSPVDLQVRNYPIVLTDDLVGAAREVADIVTTAVATETLPPRPCRTPADGVARFCQHIGSCFADWQPEDPIALEGEVVELAESLLDVDGQLRVVTEREKALKAERDDLRAQLRGWVNPGKTYTIGGIELKVTSVKARETFALKDALAAGAVTQDQVAPFVKVGQPSERWSVAVDDDAGEVEA